MHLARTLLVALLATGPVLAQTPANAPTKANKAQAAAPAQASAKTQAKAQAKVDKDDDRAPSDDEALAIAALEGLMAQPPERALPILKKVLAGTQSKRVKRRALFVLSQVHSPEAREILLQTARSQDSQVRGEAIRNVGISGDPKSLDALQEIYNTADEDTKGQILQAWMIAGHKKAVYEAALNAKTEDETEKAVRMLGIMGATEELRKLADRPNGARGLADAYAIGGDLEGLRKLAESSPDRDMRIDATRKIGIIHSEGARAALRDIYAKTTDEEVRGAALHGMLIGGDDQGVLALYRVAKTAEEKRSLLRMLSMMNGDAALEAIDAALEKKP